MKQRGRPRKSLPYADARILIHEEMLKSGGEYRKWWLYNRPARMPKNPQRAYQKEWIGWGDFLGHSNPFPCARKKFRTHAESRAWAQTLRLGNRAQWFEYCKRSDFPEDVPRRPDIYFQKSLDWVSWRNFLGYTVRDKIAVLGETDHIILITKTNKRASNIYDIGLTVTGMSEVLRNQREQGFFIVGAYYHDKTSDWVALVSPFMRQYEERSYIVPNIADILSVLSLNYLPVKW